MECGSCFDTYDEETRIPRNLPCGHTYCEMCLKRYLAINKKLECFSCRTRTDLISVSQLSKNFVAAELASKHRELQKKLQLCPVHKGEEIRFFCENCSQNICASCVLDHSGHKFIKQDHSVQFLRVRIGKLKDSLKDRVGDAKKLQSMLDLSKEAKKKRKETELARIETEFSKLVTKLAERKAAVTAEFEKLYDEEMATVTKEETVKAEVTKKMINSLDDLTKMGEKVEKMKVIQGDDLLKRVDDVETTIQESLKILGDLPPTNENNFPKVLFDMKVLKEVSSFGFVCRKKTHHRLLFFGEKNKILSLNLKTNEWSIIRLTASDFSNSKVPEFNYYSAAASLPTGDVVITGGGISKSSLIFMNNTIHSLPDMNAIRKEHACVALGEVVFVLGGYDGKVFSFLSSCEKFDFETHKWTTIAPMKVAKCAFAACAVGPKHIYTFGGYDGIQRLNTIERYDAELNEWTVLDIKLKEALSNCAAFSPNDSQIIVLGGGCNNGFSYEVCVLNLIDNKWSNLMSMPEGRDLRNKMIYFQGSAYAIGGNNCKAERLNVAKNEWVSLPNYASHVNDNLDSWACALTYDIGRPKRSHFEAGQEEIPAISQHFDPAVSGLIQPPYMDFDFYNASGVHNINPSYMYMDQHEDISYQNDHDDLNFDESY